MYVSCKLRQACARVRLHLSVNVQIFPCTALIGFLRLQSSSGLRRTVYYSARYHLGTTSLRLGLITMRGTTLVPLGPSITMRGTDTPIAFYKVLIGSE